MKQKAQENSLPVNKALEITMRDVQDALEEIASMQAFCSVPNTLEILSIEPPMQATAAKADVVSLHGNRCTNVVDYLIQREQRLAS